MITQYKPFIDVGTDISVPTSMIAAVIPFLCLLHINFWVLICVLILLKAKCDHIHHVCTNGLAHTCWRWSLRAFSLLTAYQFLSADFYSQGALTTARIRVTIQHLHKKDEAALCSLLFDCSDHMFIIFFCTADHIVLFDICGALWYNNYGSIRRTDFGRCIKAFALMSCEASFLFFSALFYLQTETTYQSFSTRIWPHLWP